MKRIKVLDLCSGTQSVKEFLSKKFEVGFWMRRSNGIWYGYKTVTSQLPIVDYAGIDIFSPNDKNMIIDLTTDFTFDMILDRLGNWKPDFVWASPTCKSWSIAAISHHFKVVYDGKKIVERIPTSEFAKLSVKMVNNIKKVIEHFAVPFAIENPRGTLRKHPVFKDFYLDTAMYCKYGDTRMKPTDIWSNSPLQLKKCKNGNPCHEAAPRGSSTGTQGLKNNTERSKVPPMLIDEVWTQLMEENNSKELNIWGDK